MTEKKAWFESEEIETPKVGINVPSVSTHDKESKTLKNYPIGMNQYTHDVMKEAAKRDGRTVKEWASRALRAVAEEQGVV